MSDHAHHEHHATPWQRLKGLLAQEKRDLWVAVLYSAAIGILSLVVPVATTALVNTVAFGTVLQPLVYLSLAVLLVLVVSGILQAFRMVVVEYIQRRVFVRTASEVSDKLLRIKTEFYTQIHVPELVNRFLDVATVQKAGATLLVDGLSIVMQTLVGMALLAVYHPWLLVFDAFLVVIMMVILFGLGRGAVRTSVAESIQKYETVAWLEELARHPVTFRSSHGVAYAMRRADRHVRDYLTERGRHFRILLRQTIGSLALQALASAALLGVGGWLVISGQLTLGQLVAAELVVSLVVSGFAKFGKQLETFYDLMAAMDKLGHLTDLPTVDEASGEEPSRRSGPARVKLQDVSFRYSGKTWLLNGLNWEVAPGAKIGLHARSGRGKSTLLDVLYGLRTPETGHIELDGADYRDLNLTSLRGNVALVRGVEVFTGTIAENVLMGREGYTSADVREALMQVGLLDIVNALPEGLDAPMSTGGAPLSPSQALRLMVARAIVARPRVLLLDEVLDHIDDLQVGGPLVKALFAPGAPWTLIATTEDPAMWPLCDRVCLLVNGEVLDEAVARQRGFFATEAQ